MADVSPKAISLRFFQAVGWCSLFGLTLGLIYRFGNGSLKGLVVAVLTEHSAPLSFHLLASVVVASLGLAVLLFGRTSSPTPLRVFLIYRPAEVALALCALFAGLLLGFAVGQPDPASTVKLALAAVLILLFPGGLLVAVVWASFHGRITQNEPLARACGLALVVAAMVVLWWQHAL